MGARKHRLPGMTADDPPMTYEQWFAERVAGDNWIADLDTRDNWYAAASRNGVKLVTEQVMKNNEPTGKIRIWFKGYK